jgi:hypothetical protein
MLYSNNNKYPEPLPSRIRLSDGSTRTDPTTFTEEEILNAGYVLAPDAPSYSYPDKLLWTGTDWLVAAPTINDLETQWLSIKNQCKQLLNETDYKVIKAYELNEPLDPAYVAYRQELRDLYNNVNNIDPWNVVWPAMPTSSEE